MSSVPSSNIEENVKTSFVSSLIAKLKKKKGLQLFLIASPFLILVFIFSYAPLYGWIYSLFEYHPGIPLLKNKFVGLQWFKSIFSTPTQVKEIIRVMKNTLAISGLGIVASIFPVMFAVFLVEIKSTWFRKGVQILTTLPNFIGWVLVYSFAFALFSTDSGVVNEILVKLGLVHDKVQFLANDSHTWLKMALWSLWKFLGWNAILYLATITSIDPSLYEAAEVDGAGRFRKMWHITIPGISSTYFVLLLLQIANFINNGMDQYFVFQNPMNSAHIQVLDLYVYNIGMMGYNFSLATAVSMMKSIVSIFLLFIANRTSKLVRGESII